MMKTISIINNYLEMFVTFSNYEGRTADTEVRHMAETGNNSDRSVQS
jgi:hypothetical protein